VQKQDHRRVGWPCFPVEELAARYGRVAVVNGCHGYPFESLCLPHVQDDAGDWPWATDEH
jgi:hypothetical protein